VSTTSTSDIEYDIVIHTSSSNIFRDEEFSDQKIRIAWSLLHREMCLSESQEVNTVNRLFRLPKAECGYKLTLKNHQLA
jgi:hypothetical protein